MRKKKVFLALLVIAGMLFLIWGVNVIQEKRTTKLIFSKTEVKDISQLDKLIAGAKTEAFDAGLGLAEKLIQEGKFLDAKEVYKKLIRVFPGHPRIAEVGKNLEALNTKILFSPIKTDYSLIYEVKPGDNLFKIAKEYNTTVELIKRSNNLTSDLIRPGQKLKVVNAKVSIIIDKSQNNLTMKINDEIIKTYSCSTGESNSTPIGKFTIVNKIIDPIWFKAGAVVPADSPDNILGSRWMGFDLPGYGIHGTTQPETIGKQITEGCVRMHNCDVEELFDVVPLGTEVVIID